jgi:two-component system response regulator DctR
MQPTEDALVFIVDDDAGVREALAWLLRSRRLPSQSFNSADAFIEFVETHENQKAGSTAKPWQPNQPGCLLLDVRMPGTSGLALFEQLITRGLLESLPVIFLTGHADVPTAVDSVKRGAFDFCEKPFSDNALVDRIEQALAKSAQTLQALRTKQSLQHNLSDLTDRERDVMHLVVEGLPNKLIADQLDISVRTVEVHRARVFDKMNVKSAVELANLLRNE